MVLSKKTLIGIFKFFIVLILAISNTNCWAQDDPFHNPEVTHYHLILFQGGEEVDCYNPLLPLEIQIFQLYAHDENTPFAYIDYSSEGEHNAEAWSLSNFDENNVQHLFFGVGHFRHKTPNFSGALEINVYIENSHILSSSDELYLIDHSYSFPFCISEFKGTEVLVERELYLREATEYYIFNSTGQLIKTLTSFDYDIEDLSLIKGIYFVVEQSKNNKKSVRRIVIL